MKSVGNNTDEAEVIACICAGSTHLFHELIRPYERTVYGMVLALVRSKEDAEDIAQETFLKAFRFLGTFRADSKFSTWLISIALNEAKLKLRRSKTVALESLDENAEDRIGISPQVLIDWREIPSAVIEQRETRRLLQEAVMDLPLIYREVFILRDVEELSISEAATALGISISVVKVRLHRARIMLQKQLAPQFKHLAPKRRWLPW
jgi:RNA polymerase sigma-70 factor (ECF subfamily)